MRRERISNGIGSPLCFIITINNSSLNRALRWTFSNSISVGVAASVQVSSRPRIIKACSLLFFCILDTVSEPEPSVLLQYFKG
ncbi:MAG: hypothetical protein LBT99_00865 [Bifidobacteriaceae bacterium]|nr:hypothetical protein [Bifidobacteriaceae bacterium]